jgi:hypothetical protein
MADWLDPRGAASPHRHFRRTDHAQKSIQHETCSVDQLEMGRCNPDPKNLCSPDQTTRTPCNPNGHCGPNDCQPVRAKVTATGGTLSQRREVARGYLRRPELTAERYSASVHAGAGSTFLSHGRSGAARGRRRSNAWGASMSR